MEFTRPQPRRLVVSIDAGGLRAVLIAGMILQDVENVLGTHGVSLWAGTSGGSIVAACCAMGMLPDGLLETAQRLKRQAFDRPWWYRILSANGYWRPKYRTSSLQEALTSVLGVGTISEITKPLLVTTTDLINYDGVFIKSHGGDHRWWPLASAVTASCCAPFYFAPFQRQYGDGGYHAYNPTVSALAEARKLWPGEPITLLSIGSGSLKPGKAPTKNPISLLKSLGGAVTSAQADSQDWLAHRFLAPDDYLLRVVIPVEAEMDDVSDATNQRVLSAASTEMQQPEFRHFVQHLMHNDFVELG